MIISPQSLAGLRTGFKTAFNNAFNAAPSSYEKVAMVVPSSAAAEKYPFLTDLSDLREWIGDRIINNLKESDYTLKNIPFEKTIGVKRDDIDDDQIGLYSNRFAMLGHSAKTHPDKLIYKLLKNGFSGTCYDGQYFFDSDHPVLVNGAPASVSNFADGAGTPWYLLCTTLPLKPLIFQRRRPYTFVALDRETDENVFKRGEYLYGVDARVNAGYGLWQLAFGSKLELTPDNYAAARAAMMAFMGDNGDSLGIVPNLLVVPPSLEGKANKVVKNALADGGGTNEWAGTADVLAVPYLS